MLDRVNIIVSSGTGGNGCISFRREKFIPFGGPDGGNGGRGGSVSIVVDEGSNTLLEYRYRKVFRAGRGEHGKGKGKNGRTGEDIVLTVPLGTMVSKVVDREEKVVLGDLVTVTSSLLVARGGRGGYGNAHFAGPTLQAPAIAEKGEPGEEVQLVLELKLLADVGVIGKPNVGKSTLLSVASAAKPTIADYPFTTLEPVLGVASVGWKNFVLVEIPGLIEGAHAGAGLGHEFLRHVERTRVLLHLVDGLSDDPLGDYKQVKGELRLYAASLVEKPEVVVVTKLDIPEVRERKDALRETFQSLGITPFFISAVVREGTDELLQHLARLLESLPVTQGEAPQVPLPVTVRPLGRHIKVTQENGVFVVDAARAERLLAMSGYKSWHTRAQLKQVLRRMGVMKALEQAGVEAGDRVRFGSIEVEW